MLGGNIHGLFLPKWALENLDLENGMTCHSSPGHGNSGSTLRGQVVTQKNSSSPALLDSSWPTAPAGQHLFRGMASGRHWLGQDRAEPQRNNGYAWDLRTRLRAAILSIWGEGEGGEMPLEAIVSKSWICSCVRLALSEQRREPGPLPELLEPREVVPVGSEPVPPCAQSRCVRKARSFTEHVY